MPRKYWASSEDVSVDSSIDSSAEIVQEEPCNKVKKRQDQESDVSSGEANEQNALVQITPAGSGRLNLQPQQHAALFSLSLMWGRCKAQAAQTLNADLHVQEHLPEDHPDVLELAEHLFEETKKEFIRTGILSEEFANRSLQDLQLDRLYLSPFDNFLSNMAAVKRNEEISIPGNILRAINAPSLLTPTDDSSVSFDYLTALMPQESRDQIEDKIDPKVFGLVCRKYQLIEEVYKGRYEQIRRLGKGGCGEVYKAFDTFDQAEYAVKKVVIKAKKLERLLSTGQTLHKEMNEIFALAKLNHCHVVRYYHAWVEFRKRGEDDNNSGGSDSESDDDDTDTSYTESGIDGSMEGSDVSALGKQLQRIKMPSEDVKVDIILFIKMTAYPMTLKDIVETDDSKSKSFSYKHCFHLKPTIRLLLAIISGLEYIHREGIIHRDLKPDNVFLSIPRPNQVAEHGDIDISDCSDCEGARPSAYVCPHIGDFGLIHDFKAAKPSASTSDHDGMTGTSVYIPPNMKGVPLCNKRDVYSLGAIALELIYRFDSRSERAHVFGALREKGVFPPEVERSGLAEVIKGMMEVEVADRWDLGTVRSWLEKKLEGCVKERECA